MDLYYPFTSTGKYSGLYSAPVSHTTQTLTGTVCSPDNIIKLNSGNAWDNSPSSITISGVTISSISEIEWDTQLKEKWLNSLLRHIGLENINNVHFSEIMTLCEDNNLFEKLSGPSIGYVEKNDSTAGIAYDIDFVTDEVSIGLNTYENDFIRQYAASLSSGNSLRDFIYSNHKDIDVYFSNACKVEYLNFTDITWSFGFIDYPLYDISSITPSIENGGGNNFGEIKLGGNGLQAHYRVVKNVDKDDPTVGMCSGVKGPPFCMGDEIVIVEDSCYTETYYIDSSTTGWTWIGDFSVIDREIYLADVTKPCEYYRNVPIEDQLFPLRIIQDCRFDDFN